uniref:Nuclease HARBI1 n=1 Tax=Salarias fasciatus TaxID=181472 RepID=A0A672HET4_SALFA
MLSPRLENHRFFHFPLCDLIGNMASIVHELRHHRRSYRPRRHVDHPNLLQQYSNEEPYARHRFRRDDISYLCGVLRPYLKRRTMRSHALTVEEQVLTALCFFACSSFYEVIADGIAITKATEEYVVHSVASSLSSILNTYVKFPESNSEISRFFSMASMPDVIGVIDCTHIHIQAPMRESGSMSTGRNATVLMCSSLAMQISKSPTVSLDGQDLYTIDSTVLHQMAYILVTEPLSINGILKGRFACLNYLRVEPKKACKTICACFVLHSMAQARRAPLSPDPPPALTHLPDEPAGRAVRSALVDFTHSV